MDGRFYVASARGQRSDWFRNVQANPVVIVQVKSLRFQGSALAVSDPDLIADFLELRLKRHPRLLGSIFLLQGIKTVPNHAQLQVYAGARAMIIIQPEPDVVAEFL